MVVFLLRFYDSILVRQLKLCGHYWFSLLLLPVLPLYAQELFPVPPQIEKNVDFWTKIYSQYSSHHVVIHDKNDLSIIYNVINLNDYYPDSLDMRTQWKIVENIKADYRLILEKLSGLKSPVNLDSLNREERHVYILWSQYENPDKFRQAIHAIRAQLGLRDRFEESIRRSGYYKENIDAIFKSYGLPSQLAYLPHVESLFNNKSYSKVGAAGIWQFMPSTARLFMTVNEAIDERLDPITATVGAAQLLKRNYDELQSWPLAITAYNHGLNGMRNAKQRHGGDDFGVIYEKYQSAMFGFASKNFYAEFLAAWHVAENQKIYFDVIEPYPAKQCQSIKLQNAIYLNNLATIFKAPIDTLIAYNPAFRRPVIINEEQVPHGYELRLPFREGFDPRAALVQNTKSASNMVRSSSRQKVSGQLYAFNTSIADSVKAMRHKSDAEMEAYIMEKLQSESTPSLIENEKTDKPKKLPAPPHAN